VTTPICTHVGKLFETMRNAVIDLLLVWISLCVRLADTLRNHACIALRVASIFAVFALHTSRVLQEIAAQCTTHNIVELLLDKFVAVHLVDLLLALTDGTLSVKSNIKRSSVLCLFCEADAEMNGSGGLESKPCVNWWRRLGNRSLCTKAGAARTKAYSLRRNAELRRLGGAGELLRW